MWRKSQQAVCCLQVFEEDAMLYLTEVFNAVLPGRKKC